MRSFLNFIDDSGIGVHMMYTLGTAFLFAGFCLLNTRSSVHGILYLMAGFVLLTQLTIYFKMEFAALIFIIVYIGAVCVLMLFHVKLIKTFVHRFDNFAENLLFIPFTIIIFLIPLAQILTLLLDSWQAAEEIVMIDNLFKLRSKSYLVTEDGFYSHNATHSNYTAWYNLLSRVTPTQVLGYLIYNAHFVSLIIGGLILLVAMIGSIFITLTARKGKKFQKLDEQIFTDISKSIFFWKKKKNK